MKSIRIHVRSIQRDTDGEDTVVDMRVRGQYAYKRGIHYIRYEETEATGLDGTFTTIKVTPEHVVVVRTGATRSRMSYRLQETQETILQIPEGQVTLQLHTHQLTVDMDGEGNGKVHLGYDIGTNGDWQYYIQLLIDIQED